jgi:glycosyltransferase involved in cell wall biosynthesis
MSRSLNKIFQLVHTLSYGDAISGEVLALQRCFRTLGFESEVYAINVHPKLKGLGRDYRDFPTSFNGEVVLHYSLGSPLNELYQQLSDSRRSLIYHNLTPPEWFDGVNPRIVADIKEGLEELPRLLAVTDRIIADSPYNRGELRELGFDAEVLELPLDNDKWSVPANSGITEILQADPSVHVMHVGRLAPNKCVEDIIKIFYFLHHKINKDSKLWLVGIDTDTELYSFSLRRMVDEFDLTDVVRFAGCMADAELKALYQNASIYLCMSEHEGFCLPLLEAMYFGLPVIAYASTAVPDTMGGGGIVVKEKRHPEIAELINLLASDSARRGKLVQAGYERVASLAYDKFFERVGEIFAGPRS